MENLTINEGIIEITKIENTGKDATQIGTLTGRFVRYPGCQQLSVWLPENGWQGYGKWRIIDTKNTAIIEEQLVSDKINGTVLMTWDCLHWLPSTYRIDVEHPKGGIHSLHFNKLEEDEIVPVGKMVEMSMAYAGKPSLASSLLPTQAPISEDNDTSSISPIKTYHRLEYEGMGRGGYVTYIEADIRIRLWHEVGGGECKWYIDIPKEEDWETNTKTPLSRRKEILLLIANGVRRDQCPSWRFDIGDTEIAYYDS